MISALIATALMGLSIWIGRNNLPAAVILTGAGFLFLLRSFTQAGEPPEVQSAEIAIGSRRLRHCKCHLFHLPFQGTA